jgi:hypothetical protein
MQDAHRIPRRATGTDIGAIEHRYRKPRTAQGARAGGAGKSGPDHGNAIVAGYHNRLC